MLSWTTCVGSRRTYGSDWKRIVPIEPWQSTKQPSSVNLVSQSVFEAAHPIDFGSTGGYLPPSNLVCRCILPIQNTGFGQELGPSAHRHDVLQLRIRPLEVVDQYRIVVLNSGARTSRYEQSIERRIFVKGVGGSGEDVGVDRNQLFRLGYE